MPRPFYQLGDYEKAALYLSRALELQTARSRCLVAMGDTQYDAGKFTEAASFYERALKERRKTRTFALISGNTYFKRTPPIIVAQ
jgi:Tfp pilus assembly protein PilF